MCVLGAVASLLRGGKYHYVEEEPLAVHFGTGADGAEGGRESGGEEDRVSAQEAVAETEALLVD